MPPESFIQYARSKKLNPDQTFTVELLIEKARMEFDPDYFDHWEERSYAREEEEYAPYFLNEHVEPAWRELEDVEWLSLQRIGGRQRPLRNVDAVGYLTKLTELVLTDNEVADVSAVGELVNLKRLHIANNPIKSLSPLATCLDIEELDIRGVPAEDLSVLVKLPKLRELEISIDQITALERLDRLPALKVLDIGIGAFASFENFPEMPKLQKLRGADVNSLKGLERYPKLRNLTNLSGSFSSLEPLSNSKALTHVNILGSCVRSVASLSALVSLRELCLYTDALTLDLSPLKSLPALHELTVKCKGQKLAGLDRFRATLESWDIEFRAPKPRHIPSLDLEIVDQKTFDFYDTEKPYNVAKSDTNEGLLSSELEWLDAQIDEVLSVDFEEDKDYTIPFQWGGARSRTVVLLSEEAIEAFPRLVLGIQKVLATAKKDWIIYFQSDDDQFIVWIYPDRIMVTKDHAKNVRKLIKPK